MKKSISIRQKELRNKRRDEYYSIYLETTKHIEENENKNLRKRGKYASVIETPKHKQKTTSNVKL